jgi:GT2 family glycosyltransferase
MSPLAAPQSTVDAETKSRAYQALKERYLAAQARFAQLEDLLRRGDSDAVRRGQANGELPNLGPVTIVIPVWNESNITKACVASLWEHTALEYDIVLIDNGSESETRQTLDDIVAAAPRKNVRVIRNDHNEGFAFACNQGIAATTAPWVVLLNNDVVVTERWLTRMLAFASLDPNAGLVGPRTNRASGPQVVPNADYGDLVAMERFARAHCAGHRGDFKLETRVVGLCLLVSRAVIDRIGGLDPCFFPGNFEDDDYCLRAVRAGFQPVVVDDVFVHHAQSATFRGAKLDYAATLRDNWRWFQAKHAYAGEYGPYPARQLARNREFDSELDAVPVAWKEIFHPTAPSIGLEGARARRELVFATPDHSGWERVLSDFVANHTPNDDVTLVLRIEPPIQSVLDAVIARVNVVLAASGKSETDSPDVLAEVTSIPSSLRGGLYRAVQRVILTGAPRDRVYRREAEACGVEIVGG